MIAFWDGLDMRPQVDGQPSASQSFPAAGRSNYTWPALFAPLPGLLPAAGDGTGAAELPLVPVSPIWERLRATEEGDAEEEDEDEDDAAAGGLPRYEHCFQW